MGILDLYLGLVVVIFFGALYVAYKHLKLGASDPGGYMRRGRVRRSDSDENISAPTKNSPQD